MNRYIGGEWPWNCQPVRISIVQSGRNETKGNRRFVAEFEGLRGLLAAWVVFGHILLISGFEYADGWFGIVFSPVLGVYTFMMLSGFVITSALDGRQTTWRQFMSRRFFRLFPTYVLCISLAVVLLDMSVFVSEHPALETFGQKNLERLADVRSNFTLYLMADATLLQCLLPRIWFTHAHESFLVPTWSLTIEWLFYVVVPWLIWGLTRRRHQTLAVLAASLIGIYIFKDSLTAVNRSFHLGNAFHFLTGIATYYAWKHLPENRESRSWKLGFWAVFIIGFVSLHLPYKIWLATMAVVLYSRFHRSRMSIFEWSRQVLLSKPLQYLGRISYATYLIHWIVMELVVYWLIQLAPAVLNSKYSILSVCVLLVYPLSYAASGIIHQYVEVPMMRRRAPRQPAVGHLAMDR